MSEPIEALAPTVFIVDDDASICAAMVNLLDSEGIAATPFSSTEDFFEHWQPELPGCLLLDVRLPGITGVEFQEVLREEGISIPIIFMTAYGDVPTVRRVMKAGAIEFLTKPFQKEELLAAVHQAFELDRTRRVEASSLQTLQARFDSLTPREREVMALVTAGLLNKQIAGELTLSEITVKLHRRQVMEKMKANSLADLVRSAENLKKSSYTKG
jgi:FixJ family two-component response regulator